MLHFFSSFGVSNPRIPEYVHPGPPPSHLVNGQAGAVKKEAYTPLRKALKCVFTVRPLSPLHPDHQGHILQSS
jgi:hypothetical protein